MRMDLHERHVTGIDTYLIKQPRTEEHLQEVVDDQHLPQFEWFPIFHQLRSKDLAIVR